MSSQVRVEDLEVFRLFRAALMKFSQAADLSLSNADSQIARTHSWLENEQTAYWQSQLRRRSEAVTIAAQAVRQKKLYKDFSGRTHDATQEEKVLARCLAAQEEAQNKLQAIRKALPRLEREADLYRGGISRLSNSLLSEVPKALALLDRLAMTLEQYVQIETPALSVPEVALGGVSEGSMSRGGEVSTEPAGMGRSAGEPPGAAGGDGPPDAAQSPFESEERRDVADGQ